MKLEQKLLALKQDIAGAEQEVQRGEGRLDEMTKRLKSEFKCSTVKAGEKKQKELQERVEKLDKQLEEKEQELDEKYEWE